MKKQISRRSFLKKGIITAGLLASSSLSLPEAVKGAYQKELATLIDISKCIGCEECVNACREANGFKYPEPKKPFPKMYPKKVKVADWSGKKEVSDRLTPYNWLFVQRAVLEVEGEEKTYTIPRRCMHCQNPPCADLCPWGAARKLKNGLTRIDADLCLGGSKCKSVCPWQIPERQTGVGLYLDILPSLVGNGVMYKCDRCYNRIEKGLLPSCIEACPEGAQKIGPRDEIVQEAHLLAERINGFIYGEHENGGTNTIYISPMPFEKLNAAIEKGPGKPHLNQVSNSMAHADNLAKAMLIAPLAGIAAAIGRFYQFTKK